MRNLDLWQAREYTGIRPGLVRIRRFLEKTGNPQAAFAAVHIAGTNGKGSTARMLASALEASGYRTGLYISPHLVRISERIQVNGRLINEAELERRARRYSRLAERLGLSFFEFMTALALHHFAIENVDVAVLETGLGGRFDATNILARPLLSIITDIDYDHEALLGKTLSRIAFEKAGIIKERCPVICGELRPAARRIIERQAGRKEARLYCAKKDFNYQQKVVKWGDKTQRFRYRGIGLQREIAVSLLGEHQARNCSLALAALEVLNAGNCRIDFDAAIAAFRKIRWPGRFEVIDAGNGKEKKRRVIDGAHNPGGMRAFVRTWKKSPWGKRKSTFIFGVLKDKRYPEMIRILAPLANEVILVPVGGRRKTDPRALAGEWRNYLDERNIRVAPSVAAALDMAAPKETVGITGSLYLAGEVMRRRITM